MRPDLSRVSPFYHGYINQVMETGLPEAFEAHTKRFMDLLESTPAGKIDYAYAPGKWSIREVLQHIIDTERVFSYRALSFARKDPAPLPGFDENQYAANAGASVRSWDELKEEFYLHRRSAWIMFTAFDAEQLEAAGVANNNALYVLAIGYALVGHATHHLNIIRERYLS